MTKCTCNSKCSHPCTTVLRNFDVLSITSSQTLETPSKSVAAGSDCSASSDSTSTSVQRSASSPDLQALRRNANAKLSAAREPTSARPDNGWSAAAASGGSLLKQLHNITLQDQTTDDHQQQQVTVHCWNSYTVWDYSSQEMPNTAIISSGWL